MPARCEARPHQIKGFRPRPNGCNVHRSLNSPPHRWDQIQWAQCAAPKSMDPLKLGFPFHAGRVELCAVSATLSRDFGMRVSNDGPRGVPTSETGVPCRSTVLSYAQQSASTVEKSNWTSMTPLLLLRERNTLAQNPGQSRPTWNSPVYSTVI